MPISVKLKVLKEILSSCFIQGLAQGNLTAVEAKTALEAIRKNLELKRNSSERNIPHLRCRELEPGKMTLSVKGLNPKDGNTAVTNYYQFGPGNLRLHSQLELINHMLEEPAFDQLRTREQLGYTVFSTLRNTFGVLGLSVTVCANAQKFTGIHVDERIEAFIKEFIGGKLQKMTKEEFAENIVTLVKLKRTSDVTLAEEVARNWAEIVAGEYLFDRPAKDAENLETFFDSKAEIVDILRSLSTSKKLSVQIIGNESKEEEKMVQEDIGGDVNAAFHFEYLNNNRGCIKRHKEYAQKLCVLEKVNIIK